MRNESIKTKTIAVIAASLATAAIGFFSAIIAFWPSIGEKTIQVELQKLLNGFGIPHEVIVFIATHITESLFVSLLIILVSIIGTPILAQRNKVAAKALSISAYAVLATVAIGAGMTWFGQDALLFSNLGIAPAIIRYGAYIPIPGFILITGISAVILITSTLLLKGNSQNEQ